MSAGGPEVSCQVFTRPQSGSLLCAPALVMTVAPKDFGRTGGVPGIHRYTGTRGGQSEADEEGTRPHLVTMSCRFAARVRFPVCARADV